MARKSQVNKERVLIADADSSVYAIGFVTQKKTHLGILNGQIVFQDESKMEYNKWHKALPNPDDYEYDFTENIEPVSHALASCKQYIANTLEFTGCSRVIVLLTKGGNCFRHHLASIQKYKGNRDKLAKPHHYDAIREYYMTYYDAKMYEKWEADDAACMALHRGSGVNCVEYILATIDKDLAQQSGKHVNPNKKDEGVYIIEEVEGWYNFYHQMLCGDTSDNIKGLKGVSGKPGIGKAKATKLLAPAGDNIPMMCQIVYDQYLVRYGAEEFSYSPWWVDTEQFPDNDFFGIKPDLLFGTALTMFRENADLLYMLRTPDDQYMPHCKALLDQWTPYPKGTVEQFLPPEKEDEDEDEDETA